MPPARLHRWQTPCPHQHRDTCCLRAIDTTAFHHHPKNSCDLSLLESSKTHRGVRRTPKGTPRVGRPTPIHHEPPHPTARSVNRTATRDGAAADGVRDGGGRPAMPTPQDTPPSS